MINVRQGVRSSEYSLFPSENGAYKVRPQVTHTAPQFSNKERLLNSKGRANARTEVGSRTGIKKLITFPHPSSFILHPSSLIPHPFPPPISS